MSGIESDHLSEASSVFAQEPEIAWIQLREHPDYDIQSEYPFQIRKRADGRIMALSPCGNGYLRVYVDGFRHRHHRLIAEHFLANPDGLPEVDHINHVKNDNRLDNLRWVSRNENMRNKTAYSGRQVEYSDSLPDDAEPLIEHHGRAIAQGHIRRGDEYWVEVADRYRRLTPSRASRNSWRVDVRGPDGRRIAICWHD
jgi:hypothetical protein